MRIASADRTQAIVPSHHVSVRDQRSPLRALMIRSRRVTTIAALSVLTRACAVNLIERGQHRCLEFVLSHIESSASTSRLRLDQKRNDMNHSRRCYFGCLDFDDCQLEITAASDEDLWAYTFVYDLRQMPDMHLDLRDPAPETPGVRSILRAARSANVADGQRPFYSRACAFATCGDRSSRSRCSARPTDPCPMIRNRSSFSSMGFVARYG